ncbi:MAG TPA: TOPRIM nucleotidyl transferase/hydrolase domain-containing protein [Gaiella sp.]|nr:TOPRIM nucleotidyl transferase/hydrolase domain-containing protein [Gaiella sp.]
MPQAAARTAVLVEGVSDQCAVETLARRRGLDLDAAGIEVVAIGGAQAIRTSLERFGPNGLDLRLAGLCDAGEEAYVRRALEQAGLGSDLTRSDMEALGFFVCVADLEDELIRVLGPARVEEIVESEGELGAFRTLQKQPEWRERDTHDQLRRFMGSGGSRKIRYASLLVDALDLAHVPRPLDGLVSRVGAPGRQRAETRRAGSSSDR